MKLLRFFSNLLPESVVREYMVSLTLDLGAGSHFKAINELHFDRLAWRMKAPPKFVLSVVKVPVASARKEWPGIMQEVGLPEDMRECLYAHWGGLSNLLRIRQ